jgi:hypothetical protein
MYPQERDERDYDQRKAKEGESSHEGRSSSHAGRGIEGINTPNEKKISHGRAS